MDATEDEVVAMLQRPVFSPVKLHPVIEPRTVSLRTLEPAEPFDPSLLAEGDGTVEEETYPVPLGDALDGSVFALLPSEITLDILRNLHVADLRSAFLVCRLWSLESCNEALWKTVVVRHFADLASLKPPSMPWRVLALSAAGPSHTFVGPMAAELAAQALRVAEHQGDEAAIAVATAAVAAAAAPPPTRLANGLGRLVVTGQPPTASPLNGEFVGPLKEGLPHGVGLMRFEGGNLYFGCFAAGKREGHGEYRWKNGNVYVGEWSDDKQNGSGEFKWNDGDHYKGEWKDDHRHGRGVYTWPKGSSYEGEFDMNDLHKTGRYTWKNGFYEGGWKNSTRHGKGVIRWNNGNSFEGEFCNNAKSGYGVYRWGDGATYSGSWEADDRCGPAVTVWANGMSYVGRYVRDLRNGEGTLRWPNGDQFCGVWKNGGRIGKGVFTDAATKTAVEQVWHEEEKIQYSRGIPARVPGGSTTKN